MANGKIKWEVREPRASRAIDESGRVVGLVRQHVSSTDCEAYVFGKPIGTYTSTDQGQHAVELALASGAAS